MRNLGNFFKIAMLLILSLNTRPLWSELVIDINQGYFRPIPIAITNFGEGGSPEGKEITDIVVNDLLSTGLFSLVDPHAYIQRGADALNAPRFQDWRLLNAEALASGVVVDDGQNLRADFRLFDIFTERQLEGLSISTEKKHLRKIAHKIADLIYERLTGDKGYFDTKIVYISEKGDQGHRSERLAIMDQDGYAHQFLTSGGSLVMTPRFSPNGDRIAYLDFGKKNKDPNIRLFDLKTGKTETLGQYPGLKISPRFSPDGNSMLMSIAKDGSTSLYEMNLSTKKIEKITNASGTIDVSPCYSPDGSQIVYTSDRGGRPKLYVKGRGKGDGERISFGDGSYYTPVWSPRGDMIAFTRKTVQQGFCIGVMRTDGTGERMLANGYLVEGPEWSPNGRRIVYTKQDGPGAPIKLYSVDITGNNERVVETPGEATYASWSPLIQ